MALTFVLIIIAAVAYVVWTTRYYKKHGTLGVPKKTGVVSRTSNEIRFNTPAYDAVLKFRDENALNKIFKFELAGVHTAKAKKYFNDEAYDYMPVTFLPEPDNAHDSNAVMVKDKYGETIGYVPKDTTKGVNKVLNSGVTNSYVKDIRINGAYLNVDIGIDYYFPPKP